MKNRTLSFFLVLVLFFLIESCASPSPSDQMMGVVVEYVEILKSTHIKSQRDIDLLKQKIDSITNVKEEIKKFEMQLMEKMNQKEIEEYSIKMMNRMKSSGIMEISEKEEKRIRKEAEYAGLEFDLF